MIEKHKRDNPVICSLGTRPSPRPLYCSLALFFLLLVSLERGVGGGVLCLRGPILTSHLDQLDTMRVALTLQALS